MTRNGKITPRWLHFFIIIVLLMGIFFRCVNLDRKVFWNDEIATIYKISGYTDYKGAFNGQIITISDLRKYQRPDPEMSVIDIVKELTTWDSKHAPLYFVIARFWAQWFGSSAAALRSLSALISLLVFPCIYWLCLELFQSSLVGWVAVALIAISPFHVLYAQEARMYSLQTVTILLSCAVLLRVIRVNTVLGWGLYAASLSLSIYTHTLSALVAIAHGIYVVAIAGVRLSKVLVAYLIAASVGLLTFLPWLFFILANYDRVSKSVEWQNKTIPLPSLVAYWEINLSRIFLDLIPTYQTDTDFSSFKNTWSTYLIRVILIMVGYSIYFLWRYSSKRIGLFIFTLIGVSALPLVLPDLIFGGIRSLNNRYLIAFYLGIHLAVAYLFATKITSASAKFWQQKLWQIALIALISCGVLSCAIISPAETWWNKYYSSESIPIARIVNQTKYPLVIVVDDYNWSSRTHVWSIIDFLEPKVRLQLVVEQNISRIPDGFSDVFLFCPSKELQDGIKKEHKVKIAPVFEGTLSLWKLEKL
jgi:uncharacterized membrane protein